MSKYLTAGQIEAFGDDVKHAYQAEGSTLRKTARAKNGVVGGTYQFPTLSKGTATPRVPQTDVIPMNVVHARVTATLTDWNAPEYTDVFDQPKNNVDEQKELSFTIGSALGRRDDQVMLDALDAASTSQTVAHGSANLTTAKFRSGKRFLDKIGAGKTDRYAVIHANNLYGMLGDSDADTFDKNAVKALVDGEINKWLGFEVITLEDRDEGGLPVASSIRTTYFYHGGPRGTLGLAVGIDMRTEVNYIAEKTSWLANGLYSAGAVGIEATGIVEIFCDESGVV